MDFLVGSDYYTDLVSGSNQLIGGSLKLVKSEFGFLIMGVIRDFRDKVQLRDNGIIHLAITEEPIPVNDYSLCWVIMVNSLISELNAPCFFAQTESWMCFPTGKICGT